MAKNISEALNKCRGCENPECEDCMENDMENPSMPAKKGKGKAPRGFLVIPISKALMERDEPSAEDEE